MKYIKQFGIILLITFIGEILKNSIPMPIPASIYGLMLMFAALQLKIVKVSDVKEAASFLIEIMPIMFIPAAVGLLVSWRVLRGILLPITVITLLTTIIVMAVTGRMTQFLIRKDKEAE